MLGHLKHVTKGNLFIATITALNNFMKKFNYAWLIKKINKKYLDKEYSPNLNINVNQHKISCFKLNYVGIFSD